MAPKGTRDFARALGSIGYDCQIIVPAGVRHNLVGCEGLKVVEYDNLRDITEAQDACYFPCSGEREYRIMGCPELNHAIFSAREPFGDRFAAVSAWLARRDQCKEYVPHVVGTIIDNDVPIFLRDLVEGKTVIGWLGGEDAFDRPSAKRALVRALSERI